MKIISLDIGFGDLKVSIFSNGDLEFFKELSAISKIENSEKFDIDHNVVEYNNKLFYVGENAVRLNQNSMIEIRTFQDILGITPLILLKMIKKYGKFDYYAISISIAFINYSKSLKEYLIKSLDFLNKDNLYILPQGIGAKVALQEIGLDPFNRSSYFIPNYLGIDIGFNTIDVFKVIGGKVSSQDIQGFEEWGVIRIANKIIRHIKRELKIDINLPIAKEIINSGIFKYRGNIYEIPIDDIKTEYVIEFVDFIEKNFRDTINTIDKIVLFGGGAEIIRSKLKLLDDHFNKDFVKIPNKPEFYNSIGNIYAVKNILIKGK
jgi:hypothetical protein